MRLAIFVACIVATVLNPLTGDAQTITPKDGKTEEQRLLVTEDEYVAAEVNRDEATLRRLIDDRFIYNASNGATNGREEFIQSILNMGMIGQTLRERSVLIEGDIAFIFGTADLRFEAPGEEDFVSSLRYTSAYVKRQSRWRMLALQMQKRDQK